MSKEELISKRRSINFFDPTYALDSDTLKKVIALANLSPSSLNLQPWELIVVRSPERKQRLREIAFGQPKVEEASAVVVVIADNKGVEKNLEPALDSWLKLGYIQEETKQQMRETAAALYGDEKSFQRRLFASKNAGLFAMSLMYAAQVYDLDTHPMDGFDADKLKAEFGIDREKDIPMIIAIGKMKKDTKLLPRAYRRDLSEFVKFE